MSTVAKVVGGTVAAGTGTGVAGYGTYRYLTYETLGDLIGKEENITVLSKDDDWTANSVRYLVELTENPSTANKLENSDTGITTSDDSNSRKEEFKNKCLRILNLEATEENKTSYKDKVKAWCIKFESFKDKLAGEKKGLDLSGSGWSTKYDDLTSTGSNEKIKALLEKKKSESSVGGDEGKKTEAAKWWCQLAIYKKYEDDSGYQSFKDKCPIKTVAS